MQKWYPLKLFQELGEGEWRRAVEGWIQVWYIWYIVRTFVNATVHLPPSTALKNFFKNHVDSSGCQWLPTIIPAIQEVEIRRIRVQSPPRQIISQTVSWKIPSQKRVCRVAQGVVLSSHTNTGKKDCEWQDIGYSLRENIFKLCIWLRTGRVHKDILQLNN
jgi:hypothetical protein